MSKSKLFLFVCLSFIAGIYLGSLFPYFNYFFWIFILISLLIFIFRKNEKVFPFLFCLLFLIFGVWRYQTFNLEVKNNELVGYLGKEVSFVGVVSERPESGAEYQRAEIQIKDLKAKVLVTVWKYPKYHYGDKLKIEGYLQEPSNFGDFDYKSFLAKDGVYGVMYRPKIQLVESEEGNIIKEKLIWFKEKLKEKINLILPSPQSALLEALFFGDEDNISQEWIDKFNNTGTRHVTAVSGMNITIISALVLNFFLFLGFWRKQAFYFSVLFIVFYVSIIGAPSSAVRAGIMGVLLLISQYFGRDSDGSRLVVFSAFLMLLVNPLLLVLDVGFQLSFLAILGLIYLQPIFSEWLKKIPNTFELRYTLSATLAAQCFTLPILIYNFGRLSLVGPFVNLLIVPLITPITILGFVLAFIGLVSIPLGVILSFPIWLVLTYIFKIIDLSSRVSFANIVVEEVSFIWVILFYILLGFLVWRANKNKEVEKFN